MNTAINKVASSIRLTYAYTALGIFITGLVSVLSATLFSTQIMALYQFRYALLIIMLVQLGFIFVVGKLAQSKNKAVALSGYLIFTAIEGIVLAPIIMFATPTTIISAFLSTVGLFGALSIVGYTTKKDMSRWGNILLVSTLALIVISVINLFMGIGILDTIISGLGVLIFSVWTMYDTQKIRVKFEQTDETNHHSIAVWGAFDLYLDFLNLLLYIIRIIGNRN